MFIVRSGGERPDRPDVAVKLSRETPAIVQDAAGKTDWREEYAYSLGLQAYIFGFPYVYLPSLRADWVTRPKSANELPLYAPVNHFRGLSRPELAGRPSGL